MAVIDLPDAGAADSEKKELSSPPCTHEESKIAVNLWICNILQVGTRSGNRAFDNIMWHAEAAGVAL